MGARGGEPLTESFHRGPAFAGGSALRHDEQRQDMPAARQRRGGRAVRQSAGAGRRRWAGQCRAARGEVRRCGMGCRAGSTPSGGSTLGTSALPNGTWRASATGRCAGGAVRARAGGIAPFRERAMPRPDEGVTGGPRRTARCRSCTAARCRASAPRPTIRSSAARVGPGDGRGPTGWRSLTFPRFVLAPHGRRMPHVSTLDAAGPVAPAQRCSVPRALGGRQAGGGSSEFPDGRGRSPRAACACRGLAGGCDRADAGRTRGVGASRPEPQRYGGSRPMLGSVADAPTCWVEGSVPGGPILGGGGLLWGRAHSI
jgi:hypothetical protein